MRSVAQSARFQLNRFFFLCGLLALALITAAVFAAGTAYAEDRRVIISRDADYPGFDLSTLKDVDLDACQAACIEENQCSAFTFNSKAGWCFLKSDFGTLVATPDAIAGRIVATAGITPSVESQRLAELDFVPQGSIDESRQLLGDISNRFGSPSATYGAQRSSGLDALRNRSFDSAAQMLGQALYLAQEDPSAWLDFAEASLGRNPDAYRDRQTAISDVTAAAINGYIRAGSNEDKARALALIGEGLGKRATWIPAIKSLRASLALVEDEGVRATYEKFVAENGFRVTSHEVEADTATPQVCISLSENLPVSRPDLADFVTAEGGQGLAVEPQSNRICVTGVEHGGRYTVRIRPGLPSVSGEVLERPAEISVYVRDRAPWLGFAGNAYVLPAGPDAAIPVTSVNTDKANATIYRIGDRALTETVRNGRFLAQLSYYSADDIASTYGEEVWKGELELASELNQTMVTAIPVGDALPEMKPGAYVITAAPAVGKTDEWGPVATQWFIVSDLGVTALSGNDGVHAIVRSLSTAKAVAGVKLRLVAVNNEILGETVTDENGLGAFAAGLSRGQQGMSPQMVVAETEDDYAFIDLKRAAFDLSDRGVAGRTAPGMLDVFLSPERGIYRPGEAINLTALVRDTQAKAIGDLPLTLVVERPDGVEFLRRTLSDGGLGGYTAAVELQDTAMRGSWRIRLYADPKGRSVAETSVLVEDFEPERLALTVNTEAEALGSGMPVSIDVEARYLYGAPAPSLAAEGEIVLRPTDKLPAFPGYTFGLTEESGSPTREYLTLDGLTDEDGKATFEVALPQPAATTKPQEATLIIRVADTNGRAVERTIVRPVVPQGPMIGIRPLFDAEVSEGANADFQAIYVGADGMRAGKNGVSWKLERLRTNYQWYRQYGSWKYELITSTERVANGTVDFTEDAPASISAKVEWGRYRLTVEDDSGTQLAATSTEFYAGWYRAVSTSDTPDTLQVALDKAEYAVGDTARLRLDPRFPGIAMVAVVDDRLISMTTVEVPEGGTTVDLPVTEEWGPGAYVTAALYRPMDIEAKRMPSRAMGLTWATVAPGDRALAVSVDLPEEVRPRGPMTIPVSIDNLSAGEEAYITIAAVDVGILNLTNFEAPAPDKWYFGQRTLGAEWRDIYGLLIDRMQGVPGAVRSGGDGEAVRLKAPPPTQKLVSYYSGIVRVDETGKASVSFDVPDFNGTVRVMAIAWSASGVGHAAKDVFVRDPVVVTASIPRFLSTGDTSRLLVEINNVAGPAGDYTLTLATSDGLGFPEEDATRTIALAEKERQSFTIPISADAVGDFDVQVSLSTPDGAAYPTELKLGVRPAGPPVTRRNLLAMAPGGQLTLDGELTEGLVAGTASIALSLGGAGPLDVAGILAALDRYPYGCTEQLTSRALPLLYLDEVAMSVGIGADTAVQERVQKAIGSVLANQSANGAFGLWGPDGAGSDLWLDAYVTDFLVRAVERGYDVPQLARDTAIDNLANRVSYASDFETGGEDIAYALYVLARSGRAAVGDLRYYTDSKLPAFGTPLAKAHIGAAMSLYGDRQRAARAFEAALSALQQAEDQNTWRRDYGSMIRDKAAILTLAAETKTETVNVRELASAIVADHEAKRYSSTQENAWMLMAASALIQDSARTSFELDGETVAAPLFRRFTGERLMADPVVVRNLGNQSLDAVVAVTGNTVEPEPEESNGFTIRRDTFTPDGSPVDIETVGQNDRFVVVLSVTATSKQGGRIMIVDPIPAGFEIENPNIVASGNVGGLSWLSTARTDHTEARTDRFMAALTRNNNDATEFSVAYTVRAVSPGEFTFAGATVEDMYRPERNGRSAPSEVEVVGPTR